MKTITVLNFFEDEGLLPGIGWVLEYNGVLPEEVMKGSTILGAPKKENKELPLNTLKWKHE